MNNLEGVSFLPTSTFMIFERSLVALAVIHEQHRSNRNW
ncbi:hypothetical protein NIES4074_65510 (plasmid) [Cylindrospermum sp. NIES-4074]|nr:hypothetical protein NIES4074_65510 [Cylindrospermum sp. NIES-4074]